MKSCHTPLGVVLRQLRRKHRLTYEELGARSGDTTGARIRRLERTTTPGLPTLMSILAAFEWHLDDPQARELLKIANFDLSCLPSTRGMEEQGLSSEEILRVQFHRALVGLQLALLELEKPLNRYASSLPEQQAETYTEIVSELQRMITYLLTVRSDVLTKSK